MPEVFSVDEMPEAGPEDELDSDIPAGSVPCPECGDYFKSRGLSRHLNSAHGIAPERQQANRSSGSKTPAFAKQWAEFQRGAALFVSFACTACAAVLVEDADTDAMAIAIYCENKPKLRKQIQTALGSMDVMILVGALGGTARKMIAHHSLGARLGMGDNHSHVPVHGDAQAKILGFLTSMDESARNELLNRVFAQAAATNASASSSEPVRATPTVTVVHDDETAPGAEPAPDLSLLTEQDRMQMALAHSGSEWSET